MEFIISDLHFYHGNIIGFDGRPFESVHEMNQTLVDNWNAVVNPSDTVYVLGDMFYKAYNEDVQGILKRLNGTIIYVWGNHERALKRQPELVAERFKETHDYLEVTVGSKDTKKRLVMSHYPIPTFDGHFRKDVIHLYGHVHVTEEQLFAVYQQLMNFTYSNVQGTHMMLNVGAMMKYMGYEPKPLAYVINKAEERANMLYDYFNNDCKGVMPTIEEFRKQKHLYL